MKFFFYLCTRLKTIRAIKFVGDEDCKYGFYFVAAVIVLPFICWFIYRITFSMVFKFTWYFNHFFPPSFPWNVLINFNANQVNSMQFISHTVQQHNCATINSIEFKEFIPFSYVFLLFLCIENLILKFSYSFK